MLYASELFCFYTRKLHAGASAVVDNAPASFSVLRNFGLKIKKIKENCSIILHENERWVGNILQIFTPDKRDIQKERYGRISWHVSRGESHSFYFISFAFLSQKHNLRKRYGLEACTRRLVLESDQPSLLHYLSRLSLCSGNSMQSLGLAFNFHEKGILTAKIYSIN